jgi:hypothetical protein
MPFESFTFVPVTDELLRHVWEGEVDLGKGGHRCGLGREGKTEFPRHWTLYILREAVELTLSSPQWVHNVGFKTVLLREVAQVILVIELRKNRGGHYIYTAYPLCGVGVYRNQRGIKVLLPLVLPNWES